MAAELTDVMLAKRRQSAYEVFLNEDEKLRWRAFNDGEEVIYTKEPETTGWQRFKVGFMKILPIKGQL